MNVPLPEKRREIEGKKEGENDELNASNPCCMLLTLHLKVVSNDNLNFSKCLLH